VSIVIIPLGQGCGVREGPKYCFLGSQPTLYFSTLLPTPWNGVVGRSRLFLLFFVLMDCIIFLMLNENEAVHFARVLQNRSLGRDELWT